MDDAIAATGDWSPDAEGNNARRAANDPDVMVYIGPYNSGAAKVSMPILNRAGLLMISPANTAVGLTKPGLGEANEPDIYRPTGKKNYTRVVPADDLQGSCAAQWAKDLGVKKVYILDDNSVYGKGIAEMFAQRCGELEIEVLGHDSIDTHAQEFRSKMTSIKALKPDLIYYGGTTQTKGGQICKDMVAAGLDSKLMVPDGCLEDAFIDAAGPENAEGRVYVTFGGVLPENQTGKGKEFVEKYKAKYGSLPAAYAIYSYEAAKAALEAIHKAGKKDRNAVIEAAFAIKDFPGGWAPGRLTKTATRLYTSSAAALCTMGNLNSRKSPAMTIKRNNDCVLSPAADPGSLTPKFILGMLFPLLATDVHFRLATFRPAVPKRPDLRRPNCADCPGLHDGLRNHRAD